MKTRLLFLVLFIPLMVVAFGQQKKRPSPRVRTMNGTIEGTVEKSGVRAFKGIPFAAPPVGELRWKAPQPVANWTGILKTKKFGPRAMQPPIFGDMNFRSNGMSEDCLYLNVWTAAKTGNDKLPVLVYFYGGGFVAGDGSEGRYDGESMAQKGIVAITVNYRLGVFGMLSHPDLTAESPNHASGNYTLLDQAAALQWVKNNVAAFGGDPSKITIAGESAGSVSVSAQMASPLSKNLIAGAIGESGSLLGTLSPVPLKQAEQTGAEFAKLVGGNNIADMRSLSADSLLSAASRFGPFRFSMNVDGYFFPKEPLTIYRNGEQAHVPLLAGWNSEESGYKGLLGNDAPTIANFEKAVQKVYGDYASEVLKVYHPATDADVEQVATDLAGDRFIGFSTWRWTHLHAQTGGNTVYRYYYMRPRPAMTPEMGNATAGLAGGVQKSNPDAPRAPLPKGAVHSAEIEYAMGNLHYNKVYRWNAEDYAVSRQLQTYFVNFVKTGNPNAKAQPQWTPVSNNKVPVMHIDVRSKLMHNTSEQRYKVLEGFGNGFTR